MNKKNFPFNLLDAQKKIPLLILDQKGAVQGANAAFLKISGFTKTELIGKKTSFLLPKPFHRSFEKLLREARAKKVVMGEFNFMEKKGTLVEGKITLLNPRSTSQVVGVLNVGDNIDRLRNEIDAVNRIADHNLKKLVKTNEKLQEARKAEQEALNTKEKFLTNISHELRTPLTGISGISQLLARTRLNPQQKDYVDNILRSTDNLVSMINELLDLSKIKSGKFDLDLHEFPLYECLKNVASAFSIISNNKNITFNFSYDKQIPPVVIGDSLRISQIINNLLNNAFKFTHEGYIHLNVTQKKVSPGLVWVDFEVTDTGIGIDKEKLKAIFEEFKQAEVGTARLYGGTGLGLSISQHLVKLHKGEIYVKSKLKKGSSFYFSLPLPIGKKVRQSDTKISERLKGYRILVADDNLVNILVIENILKKEGVHVINAADGKEAYQKFKMKEVDLILLDLNMPKMDGYELAKILRKKENSTVPIIAITAGNPESVEKKCYECGFTDIIFKPFRNEDFVARLLKYLAKGKTEEKKIDATLLDAITTEVKKPEGPDFSTIESISGGEPAIFNDLLKSIIDNINVEIPRLNKALDSGDLKTIHFVAHKIKTSYGYVGIQDELEKLKNIEILSESDGNIEQMRGLFTSVYRTYPRLVKKLEKSFK
jgi:PAS domain S-box-containing protein